MASLATAVLGILTAAGVVYAVLRVSDTGVAFVGAVLPAVVWTVPWTPGTRGRGLARPRRCATGPPRPRRAGLFTIHSVRVDAPTEVLLITTDCGVVDQCGLAYRPGPRPDRWRYWNVRGPWYLVYEPF